MIDNDWYMMTATMPFCLTVCITLIIIQTKSLKHYILLNDDSVIFTKKVELICLYGVYIVGAMCAIQCFLCHISNLFPEYYCIYGMPACVILYAGGKTFLYGFFLERAKCAQSTINLLPKYVFDYILPLYIAFYFVVYLVLCPLSFRGSVINPFDSTNKHSPPTACLFGKYEQWVFYFGAAVDIFNSIFFLFLFIYPLYDTTKRSENFKDSSAHKTLRNELVSTIKYNITCSFICMISSVTFLFVMAFAETGNIGYYLWFGGNIDIMINCICTFLMVGANRGYIMQQHPFSCDCCLAYKMFKKAELNLANSASNPSSMKSTDTVVSSKAVFKTNKSKSCVSTTTINETIPTNVDVESSPSADHMQSGLSELGCDLFQSGLSRTITPLQINVNQNKQQIQANEKDKKIIDIVIHTEINHAVLH